MFLLSYCWPTASQSICSDCTHPAYGCLLVYRAFGLDGSGALLTRLRVALTELETGYQVACEAALTALGKHPFIPSLLNTFLTSKVLAMLLCILSFNCVHACGCVGVVCAFRCARMTMRGSSLCCSNCYTEEDLNSNTRSPHINPLCTL